MASNFFKVSCKWPAWDSNLRSERYNSDILPLETTCTKYSAGRRHYQLMICNGTKMLFWGSRRDWNTVCKRHCCDNTNFIPAENCQHPFAKYRNTTSEPKRRVYTPYTPFFAAACQKAASIFVSQRWCTKHLLLSNLQGGPKIWHHIVCTP